MVKIQLVGITLILTTALSHAALLISDDFNGSSLSTQWTAVSPGTNSPITIADGAVTTTTNKLDGTSLYTYIRSADGYTLPIGDFTVQIDGRKTMSDGWYIGCFTQVIIDGKSYLLRQQWQSGTTAPVWVTAPSYTSGSTNINSNSMQYKITRVGTNLIFYAKNASATDWTTIATLSNVSTSAGTFYVGSFNSSGNSVSMTWDNFLVNRMVSDNFSNATLDSQWLTVPGGINSTVSLVNEAVVTKALSIDGNWIYTSFQSATGYTLPVGDFVAQIDMIKGTSSGWWQEAWMSVTLGSNEYRIQQQWQDACTAPVWVAGYSNGININSNQMQYKIERYGTTLTFYAKPSWGDWFTLYGITGGSTEAATVSLGCHNNNNNSIEVFWDNFMVGTIATPMSILTVSPQNQTMTYEAGSTTISVSNTGESILNWIAMSDSSWLTVSPASGTDSGTVTLTCEANFTGASRTGNVTVTGAGQIIIIPVVQAGGWSFDEDFDTQVLEGLSWTAVGSNGYTDFLSLENGKLVFDSARSDNSYAYMNMSPIDRMDGDFLLDFDFSILQMDYWNSLSLQIKAWDGSWAARFVRKQDNWGDQRIASYLTINGTETLHTSVSETASEGTLRLKRSGTSLTFWWLPKNGSWQQIGNPVIVNESAVVGAIGFTSAQATRSIVRLNSYHQEWGEKVPAHLTPDYSSLRVLTSEGSGISLIRLENSDTSDPTKITVNSGGRAIYAIQGPMNAKDLSLIWQSSGTLKVSVSRLGGAESIELGQTLVWDTSSSGTMDERSVRLNDFVTRCASRRGWTLTHNTSDSLYLVIFEPATTNSISLATGSVKLKGSKLMPLPEFIPDGSCSAMAGTADANGNRILEWSTPAGTGSWWGETYLASGTTFMMDGVPYKVNPTVLGGSNGSSSIGISVGQQAGLLHFVHCAGLNRDGEKIPLSQDWVGSYMIVYEDGTTEMIFCNLEWNCGVWSTSYRDLRMANRTWWGPPEFTMAKVYRIPWGWLRKMYWAGVYVTSVINPYPEKTIEKILVYIPKEKSQFALLGITLTDPEKSYVGLVEPSKAAFMPAESLHVDVTLWRAVYNTPLSAGNLWVVKSDQQTLIGSLGVPNQNGPFAMTAMTFTPGDYSEIDPGEIQLKYRDNSGKTLASSSPLGWMPAGDQNFYLSMIGQANSRGEYERMRRLGYDAVKIHMGEIDATSLSQTRSILRMIDTEGLKASLRNSPSISSTPKIRTDGAANVDGPDHSDPDYISALTSYYEQVASFASGFSNVISINANYGCTEKIGGSGVLIYGDTYQWPNYLSYLQENSTLDEINAESQTTFTSWNEITPQSVLAATDPAFLEANLLHSHNEDMVTLQNQVVQAIRNAGFMGNLVFNVQYENQVQRWNGEPFDEYLSIGTNYGPASPFHETSDRFSLSFAKWLAAKRTFGLPYGDEGNQNPPAYEHNVIAYQWMLMMQCWDALYCQWYYGNPGSQNIAWLKPFYQLIYNSDYQADPITLVLSFESSYTEAHQTLVAGGHSPSLCHYGLANVLRELNLNPDRYIIDKFPEKDTAATSTLIIDDTSRYLDDDFADRLEQMVQDGKVLVVTGETDRLRNHSFLSRFGITLSALSNQSASIIINGAGVSFPANATSTRYGISGSGLTTYATWNVSGSPAAIVSKNVGSGKIVVFGKAWDDGDAVGQMPSAYLEFCLSKFQTWGNFERNVNASDSDYAVAATPYLGTNGALYVLLFNTAATDKTVQVSIKSSMISSSTAVDLGRGIILAGSSSGDYTSVTTTVPQLHSTVIRFNSSADFNNDSTINASDIDLLFVAIKSGSTNLAYDLNNDGSITTEDMSYLIHHNLHTEYGDANLDGAVDVGDLGILAANYGTSSRAVWSQGDLNGDGAVDVGDLGILAANYGTGSSSGSNFEADYAKVSETVVDLVTSDDTSDDSESSICSRLGLSLIAGLAMLGLMIVKLEE